MAILQIPITKAGNRKISVEMENIPDAMYTLALEEGMKVLLNKRMSKVGALKSLEGEELAKAHADAYKIAEENLKMVIEGKMSRGRSAATSTDGKKVSGIVMTEARRLAKEVIKNEIKAAGMKISHVDAKEITKAANQLIENDPSYIEQAKANVEARAMLTKHEGSEADVKAAAAEKLAKLGFGGESPKLVAKAEAAKAEKKTQLSAKQAGKAAPRKGQSAQAIQ